MKLGFEGLGIPNPPSYIVVEHSCATSNCTKSKKSIPNISSTTKLTPHMPATIPTISIIPLMHSTDTNGQDARLGSYRFMSICNDSGITSNVLASMYASTITTTMSQSKINSDHAFSLSTDTFSSQP